MPRPRKAALFELGGQWIAKEAGSRFLHRYWTEPGTGRTSRASLRTEDLEEAKRLLAEIVVKGAPKSTNTPLSAVLLAYFEGHTDNLPSADNARLAGRTLLACWGPTIRVEAAIGETEQRKFAKWSSDKGHSLGYFSRNLSVLAAACSHSKIPHDVIFKEETIRKKWPDLKWKAKRKRFTPTDDELGRFLAAQMSESMFRWCVVSLLTGGRPEAAMQLMPAQRNRETGTLSLNPDDRTQNKKWRATVREPRALTAWLNKWEADMRAELLEREPDQDPDIRFVPYCSYSTVESVQTAIERIRARKTVNLPKMSAYSTRHKIATVMRKAKLPKEMRQLQLGHARPEGDTEGGYGEWDPDFLKPVADCLDAWWIKLAAKVKTRSLFARPVREAGNVRKLRRAG